PFQPWKTVPEPLQEELGKTFRKWSSRWQKQLAGADLPPILNQILQAKLVNSGEDRPNAQPTEQGRQLNAQESTQHSHPQNRRRPQHPQGKMQLTGPLESRHEKYNR